MNISSPSSDAGIFASGNLCTVYNLTLEDIYINSSNNAAGFLFGSLNNSNIYNIKINVSSPAITNQIKINANKFKFGGLVFENKKFVFL